MANRRMISKSISISEQVNELSVFAALLFTWMIPHADDWGIIPGAPAKIKALVVPMMSVSVQEIEEALNEIEAQHLIWKYQHGDTKLIQFCKWEDHQSGLHKRTNPKNPTYHEVQKMAGMSGQSLKDSICLKNIPEVPGEENTIQEVPGNSRLTEVNLTEEKLKDPVIAINSAPAREENNLFVVIEKEFGRPLSPVEIEQINKWQNDESLSCELIQEALRRAVLGGHFSFRYIDRILLAWAKKNVRTLQDVVRDDEQYKQRQGTKANTRGEKNKEPPKENPFAFVDAMIKEKQRRWQGG